MIEKDETYWAIHKVVFQEMYDDLDMSIKSIVVNSPASREGEILKKRVDAEVEKRLNDRAFPVKG
mgnify:FL=1|jgi:hypothetical protein|tara:strand:- start:3042 stop:3236 length:195 start_codon:yes stop_codon:yes gene_type:complete